jgi:hypothetical protein
MTLPMGAFLPISSPAAVLAFRFRMPRPSNYISLGHQCPDGLEELWCAEVRNWLPEDMLVSSP